MRPNYTSLSFRDVSPTPGVYIFTPPLVSETHPSPGVTYPLWNVRSWVLSPVEVPRGKVLEHTYAHRRTVPPTPPHSR